MRTSLASGVALSVPTFFSGLIRAHGGGGGGGGETTTDPWGTTECTDQTTYETTWATTQPETTVETTAEHVLISAKINFNSAYANQSKTAFPTEEEAFEAGKNALGAAISTDPGYFTPLPGTEVYGPKGDKTKNEPAIIMDEEGDEAIPIEEMVSTSQIGSDWHWSFQLPDGIREIIYYS